MRLTTTALFALLLTGCGRDVPDADVKLVGVGMNPDEIGPSPDPLGGVVGYDHVDFAGAGLSLGLMGLLGTDSVGPQMASFAPPYQGVFGFSYMFDQRLTAAATLRQIGGPPPANPDTCYTAFDPSGPIGSFTTVDVGDEMRFDSTESDAGFVMGRVPGDYPTNPQDMFIYYIGFQYHTPNGLLHRVPNPDADDDPLAMDDRVYRRANFPFGEQVQFSFPGGFARFDEPVGSIPRPSPDIRLTLPDELGGVMLEWDGPRYDAGGEELGTGAQRRCFEFYEGREDDPELAREACDALPTTPSDINDYDSFVGQMYTAPWDADDGEVLFHWEPKDNGEQVSLTVRFMAPIDKTDPSYAYEAVSMPNGDLRPAQACEEGEFVYDEEVYEPGGQLVPSLQGDPFSKAVEVVCLLEDDGEFALTEDTFRDALTWSESHAVGGVVFFFSRGTEVRADVPPAKDRYDQRHDITPIGIVATTHRIGRFQWDQGGE